MKQRVKEAKPLSFSTTMRNPERIANFLNAISAFDGKVLTNALINEIVKVVIGKKYYSTNYQKKLPSLKNKFINDSEYTNAELENIIKNSPQKHKEAGFDEGWPSRFDTWYEFPKELGFIFYEMGKPIQITQTGYMFINAVKGETINYEIIQSIFLNAFMKYQMDNPFRRNAHNNNPLVLLLQTITELQKYYGDKFNGIYRQELPLFICWADNNSKALAETIIKHREKFGFNYGNEIIYDMCLKLLGSANTVRYKIKQITKEAVDEYIRKMRITGILSLRGNGRFLDINKFEEKKVAYILNNYVTLKTFTNEQDYMAYMGSIDNNVLEIKERLSDKAEIKISSLNKWANEFKQAEILEELKILSSGKRGSNNELLRVLDEPTRLEFLTSVALKQNIKNITVIPNYAIDDEGLPTFTAGGNMADIECYDNECNSLFEVTLMTSKSQAVNEIPAITRHLQEKGENYFSVFIAPFMHADTLYMIEFSNSVKKVRISHFTVLEFVEHIVKNDRLKAFAG
jgi:hypothetical protein